MQRDCISFPELGLDPIMILNRVLSSGWKIWSRSAVAIVLKRRRSSLLSQKIQLSRTSTSRSGIKLRLEPRHSMGLPFSPVLLEVSPPRLDLSRPNSSSMLRMILRSLRPPSILRRERRPLLQLHQPPS